MIRSTNLSNKGRALIPTQMLLMSSGETAEMTVVYRGLINCTTVRFLT